MTRRLFRGLHLLQIYVSINIQLTKIIRKFMLDLASTPRAFHGQLKLKKKKTNVSHKKVKFIDFS